MDAFLKMDVFFVVTTVAVVVLTGLCAFALYRFLQVLDILKRILHSAETEIEKVQNDLEDLRIHAKKEGLKLRHILKFLGSSKSD